MALARGCPGPPSEFSACFSDAPADSSPEFLAVAPGADSSLALPEHGPCLVGGIITLDDASFTTKVAVQSGANALAPYGCVAVLDTGSPQTFVRRDVMDHMLSVEAAFVECERRCAPRSRGKCRDGYQRVPPQRQPIRPAPQACVVPLELDLFLYLSTNTPPRLPQPRQRGLRLIGATTCLLYTSPSPRDS